MSDLLEDVYRPWPGFHEIGELLSNMRVGLHGDGEGWHSQVRKVGGQDPAGAPISLLMLGTVSRVCAPSALAVSNARSRLEDVSTSDRLLVQGPCPMASRSDSGHLARDSSIPGAGR